MVLPVYFSTRAADPDHRAALYYVPHTHWEGAVFKTREEYLDMGLDHILQALQLLKEHPEYKFTLDQIAYFRPFLERYPEEADAFRRLVKEGRLEIAGGMDVMPDVVKPGGELFIRQMLYGKTYCREQLGVEVKAAWLLDTFGHNPQLPQLLRQAGYESFWFCRGVARPDWPSEFLWQGIDGTTIPTFWLPGFYGLFYGPPRTLPAFTEFFRTRFDGLASHTHTGERVGLAGVDVSEPEEFVLPLIQEFNHQPDAPFTIRISVPSEFARIAGRRTDLPVLTNELSPIFQGTYSSRIELKQVTRELERLLLQAENFTAQAELFNTKNRALRNEGQLSGAAEHALLDRAWEPVLFNQTHDLASGVMTDHVYEDTVRSYDYSRRLGKDIFEAGWDSLVRQIDTRGEGVPVVVFNSLGWTRTDAAEVDVGFAQRGVSDLALVDSAGQARPIQVIRAERNSNGDIRQAHVIFVATDVPAMGYAIYHIVPQQTSGSTARADAPAAEDTNAIENEFYRVTFDRASGALTSVFDKEQQWEALREPANVITRQVDKGDLWELYRGLDGASYVARTNQQAVPTAATAQRSSDTSGKAGTVRRGTVYSEFSIEHPFAGTGLTSRVRLYKGTRRIDFQTELVNHEKWVRYQALFPTAIRNGHNVQEIPFGALERPMGIEFPAQHWIDLSDGQHGVALLNFGMPGNMVTDGTLMLSLLRAHNLGAYGYGGGYEPGMSSESGFELGRSIVLNYALVPHSGDWRDAAVYRAGFEFNHPLLARKAAAHIGALPRRWGLLEIAPSNIVLTALKPGPSATTVLRFYEAAGRATPDATIKFNARATDLCQANLLEDAEDQLPLRGQALELKFHPFEIKTVKIKLAVR
jgi:alpha-mannosidase